MIFLRSFSFGHCVVCPIIYGFCYPFGIFWLLCCLSLYLQILLPLWYLLVIVLSVPLFTDSVTPLVSFGYCVVCPFIYGFCYPFGIFWSLCCLSLYLRILFTPLVSFGHCVVCPFIYRFCYPFGIFWSLCCLSLYLQILLPLWYLLLIVLSVPLFTDSVTPLVSLGHCVVCPFIYRFCYPFGIFRSLGCLSLYLQILLPLCFH
jgi:hypothetical protein